ncbi:unnamed protein product [Albugo candida]|uniref:Endonuclease/exonuclease/phosphatase domain-containing protein n=1 Tax=Albugo candida TaxID=65357 RepID=A0A024GCL9_9STRA|nr:unnamed protein product [Albugo candida]|eukprot:CCI44401.1 unnamed protein product [Albugo candida]
MPTFTCMLFTSLSILHFSYVSAQESTPAQNPLMMKLMTFNIRTDQAPKDADEHCTQWNGIRKDGVVQQIASQNPDFFGVQETSDAQKGFLDQQLSTYAAVGASSGSLNGNPAEWNAIYHKKDTWAPIASGMFWLGPNPDVASIDWGMTQYRTCVWGRFNHIPTGITVCVFNTHWETLGNDLAQSNGAKVIVQRLGSLCQQSDKAIILLGDLNSKTSSPAVQYLITQDLKDDSADPTFCGDLLTATCTEKFDYILHRLPTGVCATKSSVVRQKFNDCYPSDHAAMVSSFCLAGDCCDKSDVNTHQNATNKIDKDVKQLLSRGGGKTVVEASGQSRSNKSSNGKNNVMGILLVSLGVSLGIAAIGVVIFVQRRKKQPEAAPASRPLSDKMPMVDRTSSPSSIANKAQPKPGSGNMVDSGLSLSSEYTANSNAPSLVSSRFPSAILESGVTFTDSNTSSFAILETSTSTPNSLVSSRLSFGSDSIRESSRINFDSNVKSKNLWIM